MLQCYACFTPLSLEPFPSPKCLNPVGMNPQTILSMIRTAGEGSVDSSHASEMTYSPGGRNVQESVTTTNTNFRQGLSAVTVYSALRNENGLGPLGSFELILSKLLIACLEMG
jgi:hypothetical protein